MGEVGITFYDEDGYAVNDSDVNRYVVDENNPGYMNGYVQKKGDVQLIIRDFSNKVNAELPNLKRVLYGDGYFDALDSVKRITSYMASGPHTEFINNYSFVENSRKRDDFLKQSGSLDHSEKMNVLVFEDMMKSSKTLRGELRKLLLGPVQTQLINAYNAIRFENMMKDMVSDNLVRCLRKVYGEYDELREIYKRTRVMGEIGINLNSNISLRERAEITLQAMSGDILASSYMPEFFESAKRLRSSAINKIYLIDRHTSHFRNLQENKANMREIYESLKSMSNELSGLYAIGKDPLLAYYDSILKVIESLKSIFDFGIQSVTAFETKTDEAPYSVMHVIEDSTVRKCIEKYKLGYGAEEWSRGTCFSETIQMMPIRLRKEADRIANNSTMFLP